MVRYVQWWLTAAVNDCRVPIGSVFFPFRFPPTVAIIMLPGWCSFGNVPPYIILVPSTHLLLSDRVYAWIAFLLGWPGMAAIPADEKMESQL